MIPIEKSNIFNIPSQQDFFESLYSWLMQNFFQEISDVKIFLPNHRSCREFQQVFLQKNQEKAIVLPKIKAISDLSFEDFFDFLPNSEAKDIIDELLEIKLISGVEYLFFLSQKIQKLEIFGSNIDSNQNLNIAIQLQNLFDEIEKDEINLDILDEIDDSDLSLHRQVTLEFLKNFHVNMKNSLIKSDVMFASSYQNFIVNKFVQTLEKHGSKFPLIIAGSTGSLSAGKKLIKAISKQENGHVILHGLNQDSETFSQEYHPQFLLNELIEFLEIKKTKVKNIHDEELQLSPRARSNFISAVMLPNQESLKWQNLETTLDIEEVTQDLKQNFQIIACKDELEEARIIALALEEGISKNKKCVVITNNHKLAEFLKYELTRLSLNFNDSRNIGISNSKLINFILLVLELLESDFASYELLATLKNPLFKNGKYHQSEILKDFEVKILRQDRTSLGLIGIKEKLKSENDDGLSKFFANFYDDLSEIINCPKTTDLANYSKLLITVIENLSTNKWHDLLEKEAAQIEIFEFFEKLKLQDEFKISKKNALLTFKTLFSQISYFEKSDAAAEIQVLSTIEARLINRDLVIIASLNEGDFPEIESENWLGKKIRKDLGVDKKLKKVGQNAYDFCNYLCNKSVILTRSLTRNNSPTICSPFLLKFETLCKKLEVTLDSGEKYFEILRNINAVESNKISRPNPKPLAEVRPKKLAVTDISKLLSDPYSIYAKRILRLKELQKIDYEPNYAEFGSFVHKALEEFIKNPKKSEKFLEDSHKIFEEYFISTQAKLVWWPKFENIFNGFLEQEFSFENLQNYTEIPAKLVINEVMIRGKIDRISLDENGFYRIFDYKTGQVASAKDVISGSEPQLTIAALMLVEGILENNLKNIDGDRISAMSYWKLSASSENEIKEICKKNEEIQILIAAAKVGMEKLLGYFADEDNGYVAAPDLSNYRENEYSYLARVKEWG